MTALVVPEYDVPTRQAGSGEQELGRDPGQRVGLVGLDLHEVRSSAAGGAAIARNVAAALAADRGLHVGEPRGEVPGRPRAFVRHALPTPLQEVVVGNWRRNTRTE